MTLSTFLTLVAFILGLSLVTAQGTTDPLSATVTVSFYTNNHDLVPGANATALVSQNNCITIPTLTNGFESSSNQSVFAVYQDTNCQLYLYSVTGLLANTHSAVSLMWTENDLSEAHPIGETYTNPLLSTGQTEEERQARLIQIAMVSVAAAVFFILMGLYMWYLDNKKNKARGGVVPEPYSPTTGRGMAESWANNQNTKSPLFGFHRKNESAASSVSYLPPYGEDSAAKATPRPSEQPPQPRQHPNAVNSSTHEGGMAKSGSFSLLSYKVGTGAGLDPETVPQGRNAGFGLGYDLEDNKKRDTRRDSDILMRDAMMTPPHSPNLRPLSMMSDDGGYLGRHSLSVSADSTVVQMHA
ncbi:MAG: hypothetical protein BYD32DRAFT_407632 [Podila humilis]|nr:MAG: hypothetical protein BYD32DRAFT_407632 [Podila humilis]